MKKKERKEKKEVTIEPVEKFTRFLKVQLSDLELRDRVKTLGERIREQLAKEEEKGVVVKRFASELRTIGGQISELSDVISTGEESRNVKCESRKNFKDKKFTVTRLDTGEIIETRVLYGHELQTELLPNTTIDDDRVTLGEVARVKEMKTKKRKDIDGPEDEDSLEEKSQMSEAEAQEAAKRYIENSEVKPTVTLEVVGKKEKKKREPKEPECSAWGENAGAIRGFKPEPEKEDVEED
jgi:hypothetical protein